MIKTSINDTQIINLNQVGDRKGHISVVENYVSIPFDIKRVYYLYDVPGGEKRGGHAHKELQQLIVAASGSFNIIVDDGNLSKTYTLNRPDVGLYFPAGLWRDINNFSSGAICLVLASQPYEEGDYIRDFKKFKLYKSGT
jgi:hypothetical protein